MLHLLRTNRDLRLVFCAQVISFLGDWFVFVALAGYVDDVTDSELLVSLVLVSFSLPSFLASPLAGPIVDRVDRRRLLIVVERAAGARRVRPPAARRGPHLGGVRVPGRRRRPRRVRQTGDRRSRPQPRPHARRAAHRQRPVRLDVGRHARRRRRPGRAVQPDVRADGGDRRRRRHVRRGRGARQPRAPAAPTARRRQAHDPRTADRRHGRGHRPRPPRPRDPRPDVVEGDVRRRRRCRQPARRARLRRPRQRRRRPWPAACRARPRRRPRTLPRHPLGAWLGTDG